MSPPGNAAAPGDAPRANGSNNEMGDQPTSTVAEDLRRRRDAADRMPPMLCGHRDPLDCLAGHDEDDLDEDGDPCGAAGDGMVRLVLVIDPRGGPHTVTRERVAEVREHLVAHGAAAPWIDGLLRAIWGIAS